jgi:hypothetical protein
MREADLLKFIQLYIEEHMSSYSHEKDTDELTTLNMQTVRDVDLLTALTNLKVSWEYHLAALDLLNKYPNSTQLLYLLYQQTTAMYDYEEGLNLLDRLNALLPTNSILVYQKILMKEKLEQIQAQALLKEVYIYESNSTFIRIDSLIPVSKDLIETKHNTVKELQNRLLNVKRLPDFQIRMKKLMLLWVFILAKLKTSITYPLQQQ